MCVRVGPTHVNPMLDSLNELIMVESDQRAGYVVCASGPEACKSTTEQYLLILSLRVLNLFQD